MQFGNTAIQTAAATARGFRYSAVADSIAAAAPCAVTSFGSTRNLVSFEVGTALANANAGANLGRLTTIFEASVHVTATSAAASDTEHRSYGGTISAISGKQTIRAANAGSYGSCTAATATGCMAVGVSRCAVAIGVHDDSADPAVTATVVTANTFRCVRCVTALRAVTICTSATCNEVQSRAFLDIGSDFCFTAGTTGRAAVSVALSAAASAVQDDFICGIKRGSPAGIGVAAVVCAKLHIGGTDVLFVDIEINLFVRLVVCFRIVAVIGHGIAPEPLPYFFRIVVVRIQANTIFQVRRVVFIGSGQRATSIQGNAEVLHGLAIRIDRFGRSVRVHDRDFHVHVTLIRHIHINGDGVTIINGSSGCLTRIAIREFVDDTEPRQYITESIRRFNRQFGVSVHRIAVIDGAPNLEIIIGVNADVIVQVQFSTGISIRTIATDIVIEVVTLRLSAGLALQQRVIITTDVFEHRFALEVEMRIAEIHRVSGALDMQSGHDNPLGIRIVYISIGIFGMNIVDGDIRIQVSAASNLTERRTGMFFFQLINQLAEVGIFRDIIPGLDDVCEILIVFSSQTDAVLVLVCITIDVDRINDRCILTRAARQIVLVAPVDNRSQQTISRFCQYTGRECDLSRVFGGVIIRNQRINTVIRATRTVPVINGSLIGFFRPIVLTEVAGTVIFVVMLLHHQCLTI